MILVLSEDYPSNDNQYAMTYVHTRNLYYKQSGIEVIVLNFRAKKSYCYEGIQVLSKLDFEKIFKNKNIDLVISHAPNIKNHIRFLKKYNRKIQNIIMVFHGHEVLKLSKYYPKEYEFIKRQTLKRFVRNVYDNLKFPILRKKIRSLLKKEKLTLVFVSEWMKEEFLKNTKIRNDEIVDNSLIISNIAHKTFFETSYNLDSQNIEADFITIRPLDNSKYGADLVRELALKHPHLSFHIYGKGEFFNHYSQPSNLKVFNKFLKHEEIPMLLNKYQAALMPTRLDSQGVMMCEMATYGIPLVTSNLPICIEMLSGFNNIFYFNNESLDINLDSILNTFSLETEKNLKFNAENTVQKEINLINKILNNKN